MTAPAQTVHGTCVEIAGLGVLLRGPPGSGKSDLALRLIENGARLVADDQVVLREEAGRLAACAPETLAGLLEIRGIGIVRCPAISAVALAAVAELVASGAVERLPESAMATYFGHRFPLYRIAAFEASAAARLRFIMKSLASGIVPGHERP